MKIPRLRGLTLGLIAFGHVARAVAERAKPFGLHIIAYDPFIEEMVMTERGVEPVSLPELLARADIISMHSPATASAQRMIREEHFRADEADRDLHLAPGAARPPTRRR